jgi:hypothetical protein
MKQWFVELAIRPRLPRAGHARVRPVRRRHALGAAVRLRLPAGDDDGGRAVAVEVVGRGSVVRTINCHHNFAQREPTSGVTCGSPARVRSRQRRRPGRHPGSMGTRSYIVEGLGNPASYDSCSHGAGRRMSRKQARRELTVESFREAMGDREWLSGAGRGAARRAPVVLQGHRPGDGRPGRPRPAAARAAAGLQLQGPVGPWASSRWSAAWIRRRASCGSATRSAGPPPRRRGPCARCCCTWRTSASRERRGFLGIDDLGRDVVTFVEGDVPLPPYPAWALTRRRARGRWGGCCVACTTRRPASTARP